METHEPAADLAAGQPPPRLGPRGRLALVFFALAVAYFLWTEHRAHVVQYLPWAILALCPLMHLFMHRAHAGHGSHDPGAEAGGGGREP